MRKVRNRICLLYKTLYERFGPQGWWPADSPFEVVVGAVLTQNTSWKNVEKAIESLKSRKLLSSERLAAAPLLAVAEAIRPSGYYNVKARRLQAVVEWLVAKGGGNTRAALRGRLGPLREELLQIKGVGPETADSILLYAGGRPSFVVDAYTRRILSRHGLIEPNYSYEDIRLLFESCLPRQSRVYNEYHALLVRLAKEHCRTRPLCLDCPARTVFAN